MARGSIDKWQMYKILKDCIPLEADLLTKKGEYEQTFMGGIASVRLLGDLVDLPAVKELSLTPLILESKYPYWFEGKECYYLCVLLKEANRFSEAFLCPEKRYFGIGCYYGVANHVYHTVLAQFGWLREDIPIFLPILTKQHLPLVVSFHRDFLEEFELNRKSGDKNNE